MDDERNYTTERNLHDEDDDDEQITRRSKFITRMSFIPHYATFFSFFDRHINLCHQDRKERTGLMTKDSPKEHKLLKIIRET